MFSREISLIVAFLILSLCHASTADGGNNNNNNNSTDDEESLRKLSKLLRTDCYGDDIFANGHNIQPYCRDCYDVLGIILPKVTNSDMHELSDLVVSDCKSKYNSPTTKCLEEYCYNVKSCYSLIINGLGLKCTSEREEL